MCRERGCFVTRRVAGCVLLFASAALPPQGAASAAEPPHQVVDDGKQAASSSTAPSRAELLRRQRESRSVDELPPPSRSFWGRQFYGAEDRYVLQKLKTGYRGFVIATGGFPPGAGPAFGLSFVDEAVGSAYAYPDAANRVDLNAAVTLSPKGFRQAGGAVLVRNLGGSPLSAGLHGRYYRYSQLGFFGLGPGSVEGDQTNFLIEDTESGADLWFDGRAQSSRSSGFRIGGSLSLVSPKIGAGTDDDPDVGELFAPSDIPALSE